MINSSEPSLSFPGERGPTGELPWFPCKISLPSGLRSVNRHTSISHIDRASSSKLTRLLGRRRNSGITPHAKVRERSPHLFGRGHDIGYINRRRSISEGIVLAGTGN